MLPIMFDYTEKILHIWQRGGKWSLNLKEQIYMLSLERHSNITRAAKELGISQPALTTFLNHLEKDYDCIKVVNWKECKDIIDNVNIK